MMLSNRIQDKSSAKSSSERMLMVKVKLTVKIKEISRNQNEHVRVPLEKYQINKYLMRATTFLIFVLTLTAFADEDSKWTYDNDVLVLDEGNFQEAISKFEYLFLEFYAPWCGHCQKLAPEYEKAAKALKEEGIVLAKVDASVHRKLAEAQGVNGYPTLKFLTQGQEVKFDGGRTADGIQSWIWSHINPGSEQLNSIAEIEAAKKEHPYLFFYLADVAPVDGKDRDFRRYKEFSYTIRATKFAHSTESEVRKRYNVPKAVNFLVFKHGDNEVAYYQGKLKIPEMKAFVELNSRPRLINLDDEYNYVVEKVFNKDKPAVFSFSDESSQQVRLASFEHPAEDHLLFVEVRSDSANREAILEKLQVKQEDAKGVFLASKNGSLKFRLNKPVSKESVLEFVNDWKDGKAPRYFKQQDTPVESTGPVKQLVGSTYESLVKGSQQDVVVLYYNSKNEEHVGVQKQYELIALRLAKSDVVFTKIDLSENEVDDMQEPVEVTKIRLYKGSDSRQFVKFILKANKLQEERLVNWVRQNSSVEVADPKGDL